MTLAPAHAHARNGAPIATATVTAVLVLRDADTRLGEVLDSLARQTRTPERLVVVDHGQDGDSVDTIRGHQSLAKAVTDIRFTTVAPGSPLGAAVRSALEAVSPGADQPESGAVEHLWLLTDGTAPDPMALARLLDAVRRSPSVGAAGPKLVRWADPRTLESVGIQLTRAGRIIPSPWPGEPDQGQYDRRTDALAVPFEGMLVERELLEELGGHEPAFGDFGADLDLSWRAHQAGHRVVVVPRATLRTTPRDADGVTSRRRAARRVALTRCAWWAVPFLALWIAVSSLVAGLVLLVAKQPTAAWHELSDVGALLDPWRSLGARWRSRGTRRLRRRDLVGLFIRPGAALRHTADLVHDQVVHDRGPAERAHAPVEAVESGPVSDEAMDLHVLSASWASRVVRNPGVLAVAVATVVTLFAGRHLPGGFLGRLESGLAGGELVGVRADSATLWHTWIDGWHGAAAGHAGEQSPYLAVVAALAWLGEHLPWLGPASSPVGAAVAALVGLAFPLATFTAYLSARVVTRSRWPRALAALAWSSTAVVGTAVGAGRLGGVVAAVLLPAVAAGFAIAARRHSTATATAATALAAAVLGAFVPALLALTALAALVLIALGRGTGPRVRGLALLLVPPALMGRWLLELVEAPYRLLAGPGLAVWGGASAQPWEIALAHPGGPGSYPVLFTAPLVVAGLVGLLRCGARSAATTFLALLALLGLAAGLAAPHLHLGTVPEGLPGSGGPITAWSGTGLLVYVMALIAAALLGADRLPLRRAEGGWLAVARWPVGVAVVLAVLAGAGWTAWKAVGTELSAWDDPRPAVAIDQAEGELSNRMLLLEPDGDQVRYQLLGREVSGVARDLPLGADRQPDRAPVAETVGRLFEQGGSPDAQEPAAALADQAVGFVGLRAEPTDPAIRTLDATAGLSRLGQHDGVLFWRVMPHQAAEDTIAPSRARLVDAKGISTDVRVLGDHGRTSAPLSPTPGSSLVVAEPPEWTAHTRVTYDGVVLRPVAGADQPTYTLPAKTGKLVVDVLPTDEPWRWAQLALLLVVAFVALPFGGPAPRSRP
jgi:GT2 family glycosyltransferase